MLKRLLPFVLVAALLGVQPAEATEPGNIVETRRIGTSVQGRAIMAYRVGDPEAKVRAVVLGAIHGNEKAGVVLARAILKAKRIKGVDLWVVPTINPDGVAHNNRHNAHGVDLNRNWGSGWAPLTGNYYSGPRAWSEPETRAFREFIHEIRPRFIVSFHQPLYGVGRSGERPAFLRRLARGLGLPRKSFNCSGVCHGTMTQWYNAHHEGTAVTVEFGAHPGHYYLRHRGVRGTVLAVLGHW
jgi:murein peptide amidase A